MNADLDELIQRHLEDRATPEEVVALEKALKADAGARTQYLAYINLDEALSAAASIAADEEKTARGTRPIAQTTRILWWWPMAAAAACLAVAFGGGFLPHNTKTLARPDLEAAIASTRDAIARMPAPSLPPSPWMSPTASLLDLDLSHLPSGNSKPAL